MKIPLKTIGIIIAAFLFVVMVGLFIGMVWLVYDYSNKLTVQSDRVEFLVDKFAKSEYRKEQWIKAFFVEHVKHIHAREQSYALAMRLKDFVGNAQTAIRQVIQDVETVTHKPIELPIILTGSTVANNSPNNKTLEISDCD